MPRPKKCRRVEYMPTLTYFKPAGVPLRELEEVRLTVEELEAVRLKDLEGLDQEDCAARMAISRPTFQRLLTEARTKIAEAFVQGKAIRIEGGHFTISGSPQGHGHGHGRGAGNGRRFRGR
ncbi:MAG: DUF134 domain-containing protein [Dethiobacteria bacterium]|nr:DUF134 domain-containing protein [Bacillota bacterium]